MDQAFLNSTGKSKKDDDKAIPELYEGQHFLLPLPSVMDSPNPLNILQRTCLLSAWKRPGWKICRMMLKEKFFRLPSAKGLALPPPELRL